MGSPFTIIFYHTDSLLAQNAVDNAYALVDSLNILFSDYLPQSETNMLSRAPANSWITLSQAMTDLLVQSESAWKLSGGTFDVTMGALSQLWRRYRKSNTFPPRDSVMLAKGLCGFQYIQLDTTNKRLLKKQPGICFDFGGIAKGYVAQQVIRRLAMLGVTSALANAGGDIVCSNAPPGKAGWTVAVNLPQNEAENWPRNLVIENKAVATSGDMYQVLEHQGKYYSHILDPNTGYGTTYRRNVTVLATDGATADWLATTCSILPVKKALKLARKQHTNVMIAVLKGKKTVTFATPDFPDLKGQDK
jgi:thiamine biosynthesis lipoprotein